VDNDITRLPANRDGYRALVVKCNQQGRERVSALAMPSAACALSLQLSS
jgi:hypothetical protein